MDPLALALVIGLGSGVLGGVVSQLIAGAFKTRGDTRQITAANELAKASEILWEREQEFERDRWRVEQEQAYIRQFQADKRERFFEYLPIAWELANLTIATGEANRVQEDLWREINNERGMVGQRLLRVQREITLLAPELKSQFEQLADVFNSRSYDEWEDEDERGGMREDFTVKMAALEDAMRRSLGVERFGDNFVVDLNSTRHP